GAAAGKLGWVSGDHVRRISSEEAAARMEEEKENKEPEQNPGLYITLMDGVPLRRYMTTASEAKYLKINVVVTVSGQEYDQNGYLWHKTRYDGVDGYVRDGQLRKLTSDEVDEYLSGGGDTSTGTPDQYDPNGASSYGYITSDGVNFRSEPGGTRIKMLNKYAMALITGTRVVNGVTWYNVNYSGQVGWVHGDYFHQMSLTEFTSFMGSTEYYQGITNNPVVSTPVTQKPSSGSTGSATQGNVSSVEDWNVGAWQNPNAGVQSTWQPYNPYATPAATAVPNGTYTTDADTKFYQSANTNSGAVTLPKGAEIRITGTVMLSGTKWYAVTYDGKTGYIRSDDLGSVSATPTPAPTATFAIGTMIPINYEDESKETQTSSVPWGLLAGAVVLVGGAGGVYAYALNQNKRRKAAARAAAARRAKAASAAGTTAASPYARRAVAAPNPQSTAPQAGVQPVRNPYSSGTITGSTGPMNGSAGTITGSAPESTPSVNPYMKPVSSQQGVNPFSAAGAAMAGSQREESNPYAAPVTEKPSAPVSSNPYARPIGTVAPAAQETADGETAVRRRATRMQRYHAAESDEGNE
ncbi:MAG: hypothetical protein IJ343_07615, partial [Clostridia bacterium]|nr:hypothetical protein [Clostridia bacterium]